MFQQCISQPVGLSSASPISLCCHFPSPLPVLMFKQPSTLGHRWMRDYIRTRRSLECGATVSKIKWALRFKSVRLLQLQRRCRRGVACSCQPNVVHCSHPFLPGPSGAFRYSPDKSNIRGWKPLPSPPRRLTMLREESLRLIKVLLKPGADTRQCRLALFDAIRLAKAAGFRLQVDITPASMYVSSAGS